MSIINDLFNSPKLFSCLDKFQTHPPPGEKCGPSSVFAKWR